MEKYIDILTKLTNAFGAPGFEQDVVLTAKEYLSGYDLRMDNINNLFISQSNGELSPSKHKIRLMIDAHSDEVGFIVQTIMPNGLIKFLPLGGWVAPNVAAQSVEILSRKGTIHLGVIGSKPPHFMSDSEKSAGVSLESMFIDIGASSDTEVRELGITEGCPIVPATKTVYVKTHDTLVGKAFDDRAGCAALICAFDNLKDHHFQNIELQGVLSTQEEIGGRGAQVAAHRVKPDIAIVLEGAPADDSFGQSYEHQCKLGGGPALRHIDRTMITHTKFNEFAKTIADSLNMPLQFAVRSGGGTNGGIYHKENLGVPTIVISTPVRYAHSHNSIIKLSDFAKVVTFLTELIKALDKDAHSIISDTIL